MGKWPGARATGKGIYGYVYDKASGTRTIHEHQGLIVFKIFSSYLETRSYSMVAALLNDAGTPAFSGGRWHPRTIRNVLLRETYTGRTTYRKTKVIRARGGKRQIVQRDESEWITIDGATPRIIDEGLWERVQEALADPARIARKPEGRHYRLSGRIRCGVCGSACVGQTMQQRYRYYRCRNVYDKNSGHDCSAKYMPAEALEEAVFNEIKRILTDPKTVLAELARLDEYEHRNAEDLAQMQTELEKVTASEKRITRLLALGGLDEAELLDQAAITRKQRIALEARVRILTKSAQTPTSQQDEDRACLVAGYISEWVDDASPEDASFVLEALRISVVATREGATIRGVLPTQPPEQLVTIERTSACMFNGSQIACVPFGLQVSLP